MNKEFLGRMKKILGEEYEAYENSFSFPAKRGISVNLLKTDPARLAEVIGEGLTPLPYGSGYIYEKDKRFGKTPYYNAGAFYMQDPSAMLPVMAASVSLSPPRDTAVRRASSKSVLSRNAVMACGTVS